MLTVAALALLFQLDLPMPPPPPGMRELPAAAAVDAPDDPEIAKEVEAQSAELEELKALEAAALDSAAAPDDDARKAVRRLGYGNPLRHRLDCAFEDLDESDSLLPGELAPITDLASFDVSLVRDQYDIPLTLQPLVVQYIRFFQGPGRRWFRNWVGRSTRYLPVMQPILERYSLPRDTVYLAMIESGFSPQALSWAKAAGPWQFMPATGKQYGLKQDFWVDERRDPLKATHAAAKFLGRLHGELGHWYLAWAGYNAGGSKLRKMVRQRGTSDFWSLSEGRGLASETKHYVPKLIAAAIVSKNLRAFGFEASEFTYLPALEFDEVALEDAADLEVLARAAGVPVDAVKELNPELKRWCTPPASARAPYLLRVPRGTGEVFAENFAKLGPSEKLSFKVHRVRKGDTLSRIASLYRSVPEAIMRMNGLRSSRSLRLNAELVVPVPSASSLRAGTTNLALDRQVAQARRGGIAPSRPEEEIPAGTSSPLAQGAVKTEVVDGKTRITYGVQSGDSLWGISQKFHCSVDDLKRWNPQGRRALQVGSTLHIFPGRMVNHAPPRAATSKVHTLASGESLWSVARTYGVTVDDLKKWNGLTGAELRAGQTLVVAR